jgi:hypothetical protein
VDGKFAQVGVAHRQTPSACDFIPAEIISARWSALIDQALSWKHGDGMNVLDEVIDIIGNYPQISQIMQIEEKIGENPGNLWKNRFLPLLPIKSNEICFVHNRGQ